jgi:molybdopterin-guanine dinucleotide biosynthesis protein MobB
MDVPGKDTWRHRRAGAVGTLISSPGTVNLTRDLVGDPSPQELAYLLPGMDLILAEGYKRAEIPKIEVYREEVARKPVCLDDPFLLALVTTSRTPWEGPRFDPDDTAGLARFLIRRFDLTA